MLEVDNPNTNTIWFQICVVIYKSYVAHSHKKYIYCFQMVDTLCYQGRYVMIPCVKLNITIFQHGAWFGLEHFPNHFYREIANSHKIMHQWYTHYWWFCIRCMQSFFNKMKALMHFANQQTTWLNSTFNWKHVSMVPALFIADFFPKLIMVWYNLPYLLL